MRTWFITGAGRGLGRAFAVAALDRGDRVVATARDVSALSDIEQDRSTVLPLDVRDRAAVVSTVDRAFEVAGTVDVVVNNAGYGLVGAVEELTEAQIRDQLDTNLLGAIWVSQAVLPHLRRQGSGHIVQISTVGAVGSMPLFGIYNASKWALEGFSAAMADEVRPYGIAVTLAQLGGFDTDWAKSSMRFGAELPAYESQRSAIFGGARYPTPDELSSAESTEPAPAVAARKLLALVDSPNPPLRKVIGPGAHEMVSMALDQRRRDYETDPKLRWPSGEHG